MCSRRTLSIVAASICLLAGALALALSLPVASRAAPESARSHESTGTELFLPAIYTSIFNSSEAECVALVGFYNATGGENWVNQTGWQSDSSGCGTMYVPSLCTWYGISCKNGRVTDLSLWDNGLSGPLPAEIGDLPYLENLDLSGNQITSLPAEIGHLDKLYLLNLTNNQISIIPPEIGNRSKLAFLELAHNQLTALPAEIGNLPALYSLNLSGNQLSDLPAEFELLTILWVLSLEDNQFTSLPIEVTGLPQLKVLHLGKNQITSLPAEIGNLTSLVVLGLPHNRLSTLPPEIAGLTNLERLSLWNNRLTSLPPEIGSLADLRELYLQDNQLSTVPPQIGSLTNLGYLDLEYNQISALPPEIGNLSKLAGLDLAHNQLTALPAEIGNLPILSQMHVEGNPLSGEVPAFLTSLIYLREFFFWDTGWCIPASGPVTDRLTVLLWKDIFGTGLTCGQPPAALAGTVTLEGGVPAEGIEVSLYRVNGYYDILPVRTTHTDLSGAYLFDNLGEYNSPGEYIDYRLEFVDPTHTYAPEYYDNSTASIYDSTSITVTLGVTRTGVNAVLSLNTPVTTTIEAAGGSVTPHPTAGILFVSLPAAANHALTVTHPVTCTGATAPVSVTLNLTLDYGYYTNPATYVYPMTSAGGSLYTAAIPDGVAGSGTTGLWSLLGLSATCGEVTSTSVLAIVFVYEPLGTITDAVTGLPVAGADVTLYTVPGWVPRRSPTDTRPFACESNLSRAPGAPWSQPAPVDLGLIANTYLLGIYPGIPHQLSAPDGSFGWLLPGTGYHWGWGCWYVVVTAPGYEPLVSPVFGVPPAVDDMNLELVPLP